MNIELLLEAEKIIIGIVLDRGEKAMEKLEGKLEAANFYSEHNRIIFGACEKLYEKNEEINSLTIAETISDIGLLPDDGKEYLEYCRDRISSYALLIKQALIVKLAFTRRRISEIGLRLRELSDEEIDTTVDEIIGRAEELMNGLNAKGNDHETIDSNLLQQIVLTDMQNRLDGKIQNVKTGLSDLDAKTSGLEKGDLVIVAGRPGMCKSMLAQNIAENVAETGHVLFISGEMPEIQIGRRQMSRYAKVDHEKIRQPESLSEREWEYIVQSVPKIKQLKFEITYWPGAQATSVIAYVKRYQRKNPLNFLVIDYLQLFSHGNKVENRQQEIDAITRGFKELAGILGVPVMLLSQLSREVERRADRHPVMADLRDSGAIEQHADIILLLYRDDYYNENSDRKNILEVDIAKQRNGSTGRIYFNVNKEFCTIRNSTFKPNEPMVKYSYAEKTGFE